MRLIDVDAITDDEIISYLGIRYASCKEDIRDMLDEQPTLDEKEIIRKAFERVVERLEKLRTCSDDGTCNHCQMKWCPLELLEADEVIKIVKEEWNQ